MSCQEVVDLLRERATNSLKQARDVKVLDWEEYQDALARLCGLATVLTKYRVRRESLCEEVEGALQARTKVLEQVDAVEGMRDRLSNKRQELEKAVASLHETSRSLVKATEKLWPPAQVFFTSAESLVAARGRLEDAEKLLSGEGGYGRLLHLKNLLDGRRRTMISQVGALYPLAACTAPSSVDSGKSTSAARAPGPRQEKTGEALNPTVDAPSSARPENAAIAIAGLQLLAPLKKKPGLFDEKYDYEVSATALGYVAHVVSLVAAYLDVPLRYPLRLRASRSYIQDPAPPFDFTAADLGPVVSPSAPQSGQKSPVEFPLFSEGQELTRSAYAVFLLNKDLEQLLNGLGVEAVGPRHTLPNLSRLLTTLLCDRTVESGGGACSQVSSFR